jgi:predicted secreted protein
MNKLIALVVSLLLVAGSLMGCVSQSAQTKEYTDPSQAIEISVGSQFIIVLESNLTTGYKWEASFDSNLIKLVKSDYKQAESKPDMVGVGGKEYFTFEGLKKGDTKVTLDYQRSWEQGSVDQKVFNVSVK